MAWLRKKSDPISERARALNSEIAALEAQIKQLDSQLQRSSTHTRFRSTAVPHGETITHTTQTIESESLGTTTAPSTPAAPKVHEPIFEEVGEPIKSRVEPSNTPEHYNEMGVRKYDLAQLARWVQSIFRRPTTMNPRLVSYLAAGGVQGLQPLRKEKRVARNRFIVLVVFFFFLLLGIILVFFTQSR